MGWEDLLSTGDERVLPWAGGPHVYDASRKWRIKGQMPPEHGWYRFDTSAGRSAYLKVPAEQNPGYEGAYPPQSGLLVGDRFVADDARVDPHPSKLINQTSPVYCIEPGLERFTRVVVVRDKELRLIYMCSEFPQGAEADVLAAYQDRNPSVAHIPHVTPSLDLAFRWITYQRDRAEARAAEIERRREQEEAKQKLLKAMGTGVGRRALATTHFDTAARAALAVGGAEFLDARDGYRKGEKVVQYRFRARRLECVCDASTLGILDAGVCLEDHHAGIKGDTWFTLESLPTVIAEAMDLNKLVVWRHAVGDDEWD